MEQRFVCNYCGHEYFGAWEPCPKCSYTERATRNRENESKKDFRAFRRQVLLALISGKLVPLLNTDEGKRIWELSDRIARAEPKE